MREVVDKLQAMTMWPHLGDNVLVDKLQGTRLWVPMCMDLN